MQHLKVHVEPEVDGGATIADIPDDAKAAAAAAAAAPAAEADRVSNPPPSFRPTRKVREGPGGATQLGAAFFGGYEDETEEDRAAARSTESQKKQSQQKVRSNITAVLIVRRAAVSGKQIGFPSYPGATLAWLRRRDRLITMHACQ
jgi:pyruvate/2-oxoglutarate dehydrogenase complex dihydrolipoamide acyltransferase (E2) component